MGLFSKSSKIGPISTKSDLVLNKDSAQSTDSDKVDIKTIVRSVFDGKPNPSVDDTRNFKPLSSMQDWEKRDEIDFSMKLYKYIETGDMFPIESFKKASMPPEKFDEVISEFRGALDITDNQQDGIIGSFEQGRVGDCGFLSSLKVIASTKEGAKIIKNSIKNNHDKTYSVRFLGVPEKAYSVSEKELAENKAYSTGDKDVKILEIAANKCRMEMKGKSLAGIDYPETKELITGKDYKFYSLSSTALVKYKDKDKAQDKSVVIDKKELLKNIPEGRFFFGGLFQYVDDNGKPIWHGFFVKKKKDNLLFFNPTNTVKDPKIISIDEFANMDKTEIFY